MRHVVHAIVVRELKTRFGEYQLGYLWLILEPVLHLLVWMTVLGAAMRQVLPGISFQLFLLSGLLPWLFISSCIGRGINAVESNMGLFVYRRVKPIDVLVSRVLIELVAALAVGLILGLVGEAFGYGVGVVHKMRLVGIFGLTAMFALSLSILAGVASVVLPISKKIVPMAIRPLYFMSGIMYPFALVPTYKRGWLEWNPVLHLLELIRGAWFGHRYQPVITSWTYPVWATLVLLALALWLYRVNEQRLVTTV